MDKINVLELIHKLVLIYFSLTMSLSKNWDSPGPSGPPAAWQCFLAAHTYCDGHTVQHRFSQSRFGFVFIAVLQKRTALPSPQGCSVRIRKKGEKRKGKLAKQQERRGEQNASTLLEACSREDKLLQQQCDPACLKWLHAHKQTAVCSLATDTNAGALLNPCPSVQPKIALHLRAVVRAAVELQFYMCMYTSSHCTNPTASSHTNSCLSTSVKDQDLDFPAFGKEIQHQSWSQQKTEQSWHSHSIKELAVLAKHFCKGQ